MLLLQEPFPIGDGITITGFKGQVEDIQTRAAVIRTVDGNAVLFTTPVTVARAVEKKAENPSTPQPAGHAA